MEGTTSMLDRYNEDNPKVFQEAIKLERLTNLHCPRSSRETLCVETRKFVLMFVPGFMSTYHEFVGRTMEFATSDGEQIWSNPNISQCVNAARSAGSWRRYANWSSACSIEACIMSMSVCDD